MRKIYTIIILCCILLTGFAGGERYTFSSDLNEKRFQAFIHGTRCMLCQNQSVAESNSMFSQDMKNWLYEAIETGQTDYEIKMALIERFGDSVFYNPPFQMNTWLLWGLPGLFVLIGLLVIARLAPSLRGYSRSNPEKSWIASSRSLHAAHSPRNDEKDALS